MNLEIKIPISPEIKTSLDSFRKSMDVAKEKIKSFNNTKTTLPYIGLYGEAMAVATANPTARYHCVNIKDEVHFIDDSDVAIKN